MAVQMKCTVYTLSERGFSAQKRAQHGEPKQRTSVWMSFAFTNKILMNSKEIPIENCRPSFKWRKLRKIKKNILLFIIIRIY